MFVDCNQMLTKGLITEGEDDGMNPQVKRGAEPGCFLCLREV